MTYDLSYGLVLDLDMQTLQDYSGNGNDGTNFGSDLTTDMYNRFNHGRDFVSTNSDHITIGSVGNIKSVAMWVSLDTTTEAIFEGDPNTHLIHASSGTLTYPDWDNAYVNGVDTDTIAADGWKLIVITSSTDVNCTDVELGLNNVTYGDLKIGKVLLYNRELNQAEIEQLYDDVKGNYQGIFDGCVAYYDFKKDAKEIIGGNDGVVTDATLTTDRFGASDSAYDFNGTSAYINIDDIIPVVGTDIRGTVSAWIVVDNYTSQRQIIHLGDENADEQFLFVVSATTGLFYVGLRDVAGWRWAVATDDAISTGVPTHLCVTQDGTGPVLYVNGVEVAQTINISTVLNRWFNDAAGLDKATIGARNYKSQGYERFFDGKISNVKIWNRALSADEIKQLHDLTSIKKIYPYGVLK